MTAWYWCGFAIRFIRFEGTKLMKDWISSRKRDWVNRPCSARFCPDSEKPSAVSGSTRAPNSSVFHGAKCSYGVNGVPYFAVMPSESRMTAL